MKLTSMTDFVLSQNKEPKTQQEQSKAFYNCCNYANFLKRPLELGMFIPCDDNGNVLEEKMIFASDDKDYVFESKKFDIYQQAKERILFKGFIDNRTGNAILQQSPNALVVDMNFYKNRTIEDLLNSKCTIQLTETAIKQIGL
jgi:hypothetical protein